MLKEQRLSYKFWKFVKSWMVERLRTACKRDIFFFLYDKVFEGRFCSPVIQGSLIDLELILNRETKINGLNVL